MIASIIISSLTFILVMLSILFFLKIRIGKVTLSTYWLIALLGALVLLIFSLTPIEEVWNQLTATNSINPIKIIILFFSMTIISIYLDEVGLFKYLANFAAKHAKNNQFLLFSLFYFLTAILTVFTSNDIVILTFTPFICCFCKNEKINPTPYLVAEFVAANTWSLILIIGNPTNIYLATSHGISFFDYFKVMALPTLCAGLAEYLVLIILFSKKLKAPLSSNVEEVSINNKIGLIIGLIHLFVCLIFLVLSNYLNIEMWLVSLICALSLLLCVCVLSIIENKGSNDLANSLKKLPYPLIPFFLSMFVVVVALNYQGVTAKLTDLLSHTNEIWTYGISSMLMSNVINNIPMSILYSNICTSKAATFASIVGSNLGAFLTPTGALAGIMFTNLVNKHDTKYTFIDFVKYGFIVAIPVSITAFLMLQLTVLF